MLFQQIFSLLQDFPGDDHLKAAEQSRFFPEKKGTDLFSSKKDLSPFGCLLGPFRQNSFGSKNQACPCKSRLLAVAVHSA
ncbi:hypothetical protein I4N56_033180 [Pseudomonas mohnii]|uniref:hypothetical protein n=1 Tax=Pseudomonas mohnii TaxID=395600 RepID=UPI0018C5BCDC|nr:hypothetical protein [Pseudomonas mohnii]MBH8615174.1 hypothetical protein [Pseudomonas mohnii]